MSQVSGQVWGDDLTNLIWNKHVFIELEAIILEKETLRLLCRQNQTKIPKIIAFIVFQLMYDTVDQFQEVRSTCCCRSKVFLSTVFMAKATNIALQLQSLTKYGKKTKWCKKKRAVNYLCLTSCRHQPPKSFKGKKSKPIC